MFLLRFYLIDFLPKVQTIDSLIKLILENTYSEQHVQTAITRLADFVELV